MPWGELAEPNAEIAPREPPEPLSARLRGIRRAHSTPQWGERHARCLSGRVQSLDRSVRVASRPSPSLHPWPELPRLRRRLAALGLRPEPAEDETAEMHRDRSQTALMAIFRDRPGEEEFEALYRYTEPSVRRWVRMALSGRGRRTDAHDLVQDAFVNIYRYARGFRDDHPASFRSWAQAICRNVVRRSFLRPRGLAFSEFPDGLAEPADVRPTPFQEASDDEQCAALSRALVLLLMHYTAAYDLLSPRDRLALELVEIEGLSYGEVGERLRVGMSNMKMIMFRARRRLRAHMARSMGVEEEAESSERRAAG